MGRRVAAIGRWSIRAVPQIWTCGPTTVSAATRGTGRLTSKKAVITGGDSGIGRAVAIAFAR